MAYRRLQYAEVIFQTLKNVKDRGSFHLTICGVEKPQYGDFQGLLARSRELGLNADLLMVERYDLNYEKKIEIASHMQYEYTIKMDEDVFLSPSAWDQYLKMIPVILSDPNNLTLAPTISSGIPTVDYFIDNNLNENQKIEIKRLFSNTYIPNVWGVRYDELNDYLRGEPYSVEGWYGAVARLGHFYKGIHPIRVSKEAQLYLNQCIKENIGLFFEEREFEVEAAWQPYFCNSFFAIKTEEWRKVLERRDLSRDCFDEVTINNYRTETGKKFIFIRNIFGVHTMYNTLWADISNDRAALEAEEDGLVEFIGKEITKRY